MPYTPLHINYADLDHPPGVAVIAYPGFRDHLFCVAEDDGDQLHDVTRIRQVTCGIAAWLGLPSPEEVPSKRLWAVYGALMNEGARKHLETGAVCEVCLRPELIGLEGKRIEVINDLGDTLRFTVRRSAGWLPVHLGEDALGHQHPAPAIRLVRVLKRDRDQRDGKR